MPLTFQSWIRPVNSAVEKMARSGFTWLFLFVAVGLTAGLGLREPSPPDEPRFVLAAKTMVESGDWLVPHRGREFYAEKPPMFMWLQAAAYSAVGHWRTAFLLPSLLAALATLWLTFDLARHLWSKEAGLAAATGLWLCLQFGLQAKRGQIDMVLVGMTTFAVWAICRHLLLGHGWRWLWLGAFVAGVGTVTKGVGFLPLLLFVPWGFLRSRRKLPTAQATGGLGNWFMVPVAFLAGTAVWLGPLGLAVLASDDPALKAYASELLFRQTGERYVNAWHHVQPAWYYLQVVATLWLPGALLLPWLIPAWWRRIRAGDVTQIVLLSWCLLVLGFFTASPGKREVYIFPILPILCVAAAPVLRELLAAPGPRRMLLAWVALTAGAMVALAGVALTGTSDWASRLASQRDIASADLGQFLRWLLICGCAGTILVLLARVRHAVLAAVIFMGILWFTYGVGLAPAVDAASSARALMTQVGARIGPSAELGMIAWTEQNYLQADRAIVDFGFKAPVAAQWQEGVVWAKAAPTQRWLFVLREVMLPCVDANQVIDIGRSNRRSWVLVPGTAISARCVAPPPEFEP